MVCGAWCRPAVFYPGYNTRYTSGRCFYCEYNATLRGARASGSVGTRGVGHFLGHGGSFLPGGDVGRLRSCLRGRPSFGLSALGSQRFGRPVKVVVIYLFFN